MECLLFSDVHGNQGACRSLVERASDVDVVLGAGDFCNMRRGLQPVIDVLADIDTPTVLVPGNAESADELRSACASWDAVHVLHGESCTVNGVSFYGIGGGIPITPFGDWSYDFSEDEAGALLDDFDGHDVLVTHSPPQGVVDVDSGGQHLGSMTIREVIQAQQPRLIVCGHIHGSWAQTGALGDAPVVNAGPDGMTWTLDVA